MHDPAEAARVYLLGCPPLAALVGDRIAVGRHLYGSGWDMDAAAVLLLPSGGRAEPYNRQRVTHLYATCYAATHAEAAVVAAVLVDALKGAHRTEIALADGSRVLLNAINQYSEVAQTYEPELKLPAYGLYLEIISGEIGG